MADPFSAIRNIELTPAEAIKFWAKVDERSASECWEWRGKKAHGYGTFTVNRRKANEKTFLAHRVAFTLSKGTVPKGRLVCHSCDNPGCVNPSHLWDGDHSANALDMWAKERRVVTNAVGEKNRRARLTVSDVVAIRRAFVPGSANVLATQYGVTPSAIRHIVDRRKWRHV